MKNTRNTWMTTQKKLLEWKNSLSKPNRYLCWKFSARNTNSLLIKSWRHASLKTMSSFCLKLTLLQSSLASYKNSKHKWRENVCSLISWLQKSAKMLLIKNGMNKLKNSGSKSFWQSLRLYSPRKFRLFSMTWRKSKTLLSIISYLWLSPVFWIELTLKLSSQANSDISKSTSVPLLISFTNTRSLRLRPSKRENKMMTNICYQNLISRSLE